MNPTVSEETARRIAAALERIAEVMVAEREEREPVSFPNAPVLPKDRPRGRAADTRVVYFIRSGSLIKIGTTKNLSGRLRDIQLSNGAVVEVVHTYSGGALLEQCMHGEFAGCREHGEWFALPDDWRARADAVFAKRKVWR